MQDARTITSGPRLRTDKLLNRERILEVAREAFRSGDIVISFEEISRRVGVGIGTLYRHFPNRAALVEALYREEVEELCASAETLANKESPIQALRSWLLLFVEYFASKRVIVPVLQGLVGEQANVFCDSSTLMRHAVRSLGNAAIARGQLEAAIDPVDLLRALTGILSISPSPEAEAAARRFIDILLLGARPGCGGH